MRLMAASILIPRATAECICPQSHPYCYGVHNAGYSYSYRYEASLGDFRCYASSSSYDTTAVCATTCTADFPVPPAPPSPPVCMCPEPYPYCWDQDSYAYGGAPDFYCYTSATSSTFSDTACAGICNENYSLLAPSPSPPPPPPPLPPPPPPRVPPPFSPVDEQFVRVVGKEATIQFGVGNGNGGTDNGGTDNTVCELRMDHRHPKLVSTCELEASKAAPICTHRAGMKTPSTQYTGNMAFGTGSRAHCLAGETVTGGYCIPSAAACGTAATSGTGSDGRMFYECINAGCGSSTDQITGYAICCAF